MRLYHALLARYHARRAKVLLVRGKYHFKRAEEYIENIQEMSCNSRGLRGFAAYQSCGTEWERRD